MYTPSYATLYILHPRGMFGQYADPMYIWPIYDGIQRTDNTTFVGWYGSAQETAISVSRSRQCCMMVRFDNGHEMLYSHGSFLRSRTRYDTFSLEVLAQSDARIAQTIARNAVGWLSREEPLTVAHGRNIV